MLTARVLRKMAINQTIKAANQLKLAKVKDSSPKKKKKEKLEATQFSSSFNSIILMGLLGIYFLCSILKIYVY